MDKPVMIIQLPDDLRRYVRDRVQSGRFASEDDAISEALRLLRHHEQGAEEGTIAGKANEPPRKRIWEIAAEIRAGVPEEEWARLPEDGAEQHDHYIYGLPKRPSS